jgi:hypothetical protein
MNRGVCAVAILLLLTMPSSAACLSRADARAKWPDAHLFWHGAAHCWDNSRTGAGDYSAAPSPTKPVHQDPPPKKEPPSWLERAGPQAPEAAIYFPAMIKGNGLDAYPLLIWQQPWLVPTSITAWPLLLDIDRVPFTAWTKRVGE